jgi:ATP-dependent Lhr-like helicase
VFVTVARKFGVISRSADPRDLRTLDPLLEASRTNPLGEETLEKTLHDRYDVGHARSILEGVRDGTIRVDAAPSSPFSEGPLARLRWRVMSDTPPPTLLKALRHRLDQEPLTLVCLRCGFIRTTTPARYRTEGGSICRLCKGALSAVLSPRRTEDIDRLVRYAKRKWHATGKGSARTRTKGGATAIPQNTETLVRAAYTSAELVAHYGERALWALAARGVGPDTARRLLLRLYRSDDEFITELVRAERNYARTRTFWD